VTEITDGIYTTRKTIRIEILPSIGNNRIRNPQNLCIDQKPEKLFGTQPTGGSGIYQYVWESTHETDTTHFQKVEKNNGEADLLPLPLAGSTWFRRILISGACSDSSEPVKINLFKVGYWKGDSSQTWDEPANWCQSRIPADTNDVYIDSVRKYDPVISSQVVCRDLILTEKSHLTIEGNLQVTGKIAASENSIDAVNGSLRFRGIATQYLPGKILRLHQLKNIFIQTTGNLHLTDSLTITGNIYLQKGNLYTHDFLKLSDSATLAPVATGSDIIGKSQLKIGIPEGRSVDRILAHPFSHGISLLSLTDSIDISGENGSLHGFTITRTNSPSAFWYDPEKGTEASGFDSGWQAYTNINTGPFNQWKKQTGIRLWIRGKKGQGLDSSSPGNGTNGSYFPAAVSLLLSGQLNTGDQEISIPVNQSPAYQIIGNPYFSAIELERVARTAKTGDAFWIWNPTQGKRGGYSCYLFSQPYLLPPFGSFIVKANDAPFQHFLITENSKTGESVNDPLQLGNWNDVSGCEIRLVSDQVFWDRILIRQLDSARSGTDKFDAEKIMNPDLNFFTRNKDGKMLSIDNRNLMNNSIIQLGITQALPGRYQLKIAMCRLPVNNTLQLYDNYLHQWVPLKQDESYSFDITTDTATQGMNRFEIKSSVDPAISLPDKNIQLTVFPVPARDQLIINFHCTEPGNTSVRILHLSGKPILQKELGVQETGRIQLPVSHLISGMYLLEFRTGHHVKTSKFYKY
ncbi:MAG: T9SS type A sorting domain-containing protein, partial [Bacteroidota bacterium]|nr:T9SS type A sorting domain-containing protein [Bacteroidota bacterium]